MNIKQIHIYGFGKLTDFRLSLSSSLQVLYGANEAGKSTLMAFIHAILFGFPTKQQSELRYEPKRGSKYGGNLLLETEDYGEILVERVGGKATGNVVVTLSDGTTKGEEFLKQLLKNMDKSMFKGIFSFNIHGLQGVNQLKGEDIGHYLLAAGTIGTDIIVKTEQQLQKELDQLFKPSGRKPELNMMLQTIKHQEKDLKKSMQHNETYENLQKELHTLLEEIEHMQGEVKKFEKQLRKLERLKQDWPFIQERKQLLKRIEVIKQKQFPIDGIHRMDKLDEQLRITNSQLQALKVKKAEYERELHLLAPNQLIIQNESRIQLILEKWPQVLQWQEELIKRKEEQRKWNEQISLLSRNVYYQEEDLKQLPSVDLSIDMKDKIRTTVKDNYYLKSKKDELEQYLEIEKNKQMELEMQCDRIESELLSEEEFRRLSDQQQTYNQLQNEYQQIQDQLKLIRFSKDQGKKESNLATMLFYLLFSGFFLWSLTTMHYLSMAGALIGLIVLSYTAWTNKKRKKQNHDSSEGQLLKKAENTLDEMNQLADKRPKYEEQQNLRSQWKELILQIENQQFRYTEKMEALSEWNKKWKDNEHQLNGIRHQLRLHDRFSSEQLPDAFDILSELAKIIHNQANNEAQLNLLIQKVSKWENELNDLVQALGLENIANDEKIIHLKSLLKSEQDHRLLHREMKNKMDEIEHEYIKWLNESTSLKDALNQLLTDAGAEHQEEFRKKGKEHEDYLALKNSLQMLNKQINEESLKATSLFESFDVIENELLHYQDQVDTNINRLEVLRKRLAEVNYEINLLEDGGVYTEKLHEFYHLKSMFNIKAKQWAKLTLAKQMIAITMERMKNERFPKVLETAEYYINQLTDGQYIHFHFKESGQLKIERADHIMFDPEELSQATTEQVYISLRLALVQVLQDEYPFPMIIDDGFVNFDRDRTKRIIQILLEMSKSTQVLLFTCHEHILDLFSENQIFVLNEKETYSMVK